MPEATCGTVVVVDPFEPPNVSVTCPAPPQQVGVGEPFTVEWVITNQNDAPAAVQYDLVVGGDTVDSGSVTVDGSETLSAEVVIEEISGREEELVVTVNTSVAKA